MSFSIEYELTSNDPEVDAEELAYRFAVLEDRLLLELPGDDEQASLYFESDEAVSESGRFCGVVTLTGGETVCAVTDDETGMSGFILVFYLPGLALFDLVREEDVEVAKLDGRNIADMDARCYRFRGTSVDSPIRLDEEVIACFGPGAEALYQSSKFGEQSVEIIATSVRSATRADTEVPFRVVPVGECDDPACPTSN